MFSSEFTDLIPERERKRPHVAEEMWTARALKKWPNPKFKDRWDEDNEKSHIFGVDRADALLYLAGRYNGKTLSFLLAGSGLIGVAFRDESLVKRRLDESRQPQDRRAALAALVLLGSELVEPISREILDDPSSTDLECEAAVFGLLIMKAPLDIPQRVFATGNVSLRRILMDAITASRSGRWLLQR